MNVRTRDLRVALAAHPVAWALARLARYGGPVLRVPGVGLVVNDAMVAHEVLQRDSTFVKCAPGGFSEVVTQLLGPFALANMDGGAHRRLRGMLGDLLSPANAAQLMGGYEERLAGLRAALERGETIDLVRFMRIMSGRLTLEMMGVRPSCDDADDAALKLIALGDRVTAALRTRRLSERQLRSCSREVAQLVTFARAGYESDNAPPSSLVRRLRERGLSFAEAQGVLLVLFVGGTLTTAAALPRIVALLVDSGQMAQVQADPQRIPPAIAEGLRFVTPLPATIRIASRDATVGSRRIRACERW
ncbi:MAG: cytochrome P450 [Gemmatimonadales bacterium]